ncbi:MAG: hypothetical protein IPP77_05350 [Bacteroidetes bacterium]|nr:hypothetical protein [Bacteroidota bacterium]
MKSKIILLLAFVLVEFITNAQIVSIKSQNLFSITQKPKQFINDTNFIKDPLYILLDFSKLSELNRVKPEMLELKIPVSDSTFEVLSLHQSNIFSSGFALVTSSNDSIQYEPGLHYQGKIKGDSTSIATLSIFKDYIMCLFSNKNGNYELILKNEEARNNNLYILYNTKDLTNKQEFQCSVKEGLDNTIKKLRRKRTKCQRLRKNIF